MQTTTIDNLLLNFIGKYQYREITTTNCNGEADDYAYLELNNDGTHTYSYETNCGSGNEAKGNYEISNDKIYLFNDNCTIEKTQ